MPSKIEQALATLKGMDILELECMKAMVQKGIEAAHAATPIEEQDCKLLDLPAELRNLIYTFTAFMHLRAFGNTQRCGLLGVNKQIRIESMDILYSRKILTLRYSREYCLHDGQDPTNVRLTEVADRKALKFVLDSGNNISKFDRFVWRDPILAKLRDETTKISEKRLAGLRLFGYARLNTTDPFRYAYFRGPVEEAKRNGLEYTPPP